MLLGVMRGSDYKYVGGGGVIGVMGSAYNNFRNGAW